MPAPVPSAGDPRLVTELQERAARALPAAHVEQLGSWWLRSSPGCAWWVGSVLPHGEAAAAGLPAMVAAAEAFSVARGGTATFQVCPGACPAGLDDVLAARGYRRHTPMSLQAAAVAEVLVRLPAGTHDAPAAGRHDVRLAEHPGEDWWAVWRAGIHHGEGADRTSEEALLGRVATPSALATATAGGEPVSIARAVADTGWAGVFDVVTLPHARGRGAASAVLAALAGWAEMQDCTGLYLQVERDNIAARDLYAEVGFAEVAAYHYRGRP